jgi:MPBQ/MSBQ methyltransferase
MSEKSDSGSSREFPVNKKEAIHAINRLYDRRMFSPSVSGHYDFHNYGYWLPNTRTRRAASENLMDEVLSFLPRKEGTILDVACGKGATTRHLLKYYSPEQVTGINISKKQLQMCRVNAPGCKFLLMDATELAFGDNYFDNIICVEAAMHFNTREKFLCAAWRVLRPGGRLVLSDTLHQKPTRAEAMIIPAVNYVKSREEYKNLYARAGFEEINIVDATQECWGQFYKHRMRLLRKKLFNEKIDWLTFNRAVNRLRHRNWWVRSYLLVCARKPML